VDQPTRREFAQQTLGSLLIYSLLEQLSLTPAFSAEVQPVAARWIARINELTQDLRGKKLPQVEWQKEIEALFAQIELPELLKFVDFAELTRNMQFRDRGERSFQARFPQVEGLPTELVFGHQMFALLKGRSVAPHGHNNMATAFLILEGDFHGRHYDRLEDTDTHMVIRPTIDRSFTVGQYSTVSDFKDNVHWFQATSETAYIFNIHVLNVDPDVKRGGRVYVDPNGEALSDDRIRARKLPVAEAYQLYG
jgi:hypothetical protein